MTPRVPATRNPPHPEAPSPPAPDGSERGRCPFRETLFHLAVADADADASAAPDGAAELRVHVSRCDSCHRAYQAALAVARRSKSKVPPAPATTPETKSEGEPAVQANRPQRATPRNKKLSVPVPVLILAGAVILGALMYPLIRSDRDQRPLADAPGEILLAKAVPQSGITRSASAGERDTFRVGSVYQIAAADYSITLQTPRAGFATVIVLTPGAPPTIYPGPSEQPIAVAHNEPRSYGPILRPTGKATVVVVVTADSSTGTLRRILQGKKPESVHDAMEVIRNELLPGRTWVAVDHFTLEPPTK